MDELHNAFVNFEQKNFEVANMLCAQLLKNASHLGRVFSAFFENIPETLDECIFCTSLLCNSLENSVIAYNFSLEYDDAIFIAAEKAIKANCSEAARLIRKAAQFEYSLRERIFMLIRSLVVNDTALEILGELAVAELEFGNESSELVVYSLQFDVCVLKIVECTNIERNLRELLLQHISVDFNAKTVFSCCKLSFSSAGIRFISDFCYAQLKLGNPGAAHALRNLSMFNGPANFIQAEGPEFEEILLISCQNLLSFPPDVMDSLAEFLADIFSYCSMSYIAGFVDNQAIDNISIIERHAEIIVEAIILAVEIPRRETLEALFSAAIRVYRLLGGQEQMDTISTIIDRISTKTNQINFCYVCLNADGLDLEGEEANFLLSYFIPMLQQLTTLEDILAIVAIIPQLACDADGERIELNISESSAMELLATLQTVLNCMASQGLRYQDNNHGTRIQTILYRFFEENMQICDLATNEAFQNAECLLPELIFIMGITPITISEFLYCQILTDSLENVVQTMSGLESSDIPDAFGVICEFKSKFARVVGQSEQIFEFLGWIADLYLEECVDKEMVDFVEHYQQSSPQFVTEMLCNKKLLEFVIQTIEVYYSSAKLFNVIIKADPAFSVQYLCELCRTYVFGGKTGIIGKSDIIQYLDSYQQVTGVSALQIAELLFLPFNGLIEKIFQRIVTFTVGQTRTQLHILIESAKSAVFD